MSLDATRWAWNQRIKQNSRTSRSAVKIVLVSMADRAGEDHICYPSIARLELDTELNRKTILNALRYLEELGLIKDTGDRKGRTKKVKVYRLVGVTGREEKKGNSPNGGTVKKCSSSNPAESVGSKQSQIRNDSENGMIPDLPANRPENGTLKQSQIRDSEPISLEPTNEPPCALPEQKRVSGDSSSEDSEPWVSAKGKKLKPAERVIFKTLWDAYDHKKGRAKAIDAFLNYLKPWFGKDPETNRKNLDRLLAAIRAHVSERKPDITPLYFERWISQRRWEDGWSQTARMSSSMMGHDEKSERAQQRPFWEVQGFRSHEDWQEYQGEVQHLKTLQYLKKPTENDKRLMEQIKERIRKLRARQPGSQQQAEVHSIAQRKSA